MMKVLEKGVKKKKRARAEHHCESRLAFSIGQCLVRGETAVFEV